MVTLLLRSLAASLLVWRPAPTYPAFRKTSGVPWKTNRYFRIPLLYLHTGVGEGNEPAQVPSRDFDKTWLVVGDGDLSYSASIAEHLSKAKTKLIATVLEDQVTHESVYQNSRNHSAAILSFPHHQVRFGVDATRLETMSFFREEQDLVDVIEFNFPHWRGKQNNRYNRELLDNFLGSAVTTLKQDGEIQVALCEGQGGIPSGSIEEWRQSWLAPMYAANHGLLLKRLEAYEPKYDLSSHRGVDRPFHIGKVPQKYVFSFADGRGIDFNHQISCRHELRLALDEERIAGLPVSMDDIVNGDAVLDLVIPLVPPGAEADIAARHLLPPSPSYGNMHLAVFLINYSGVSEPLPRAQADMIRSKLESRVRKEWGLRIAKEGRMVSKPYPRHLLPILLQGYGHYAPGTLDGVVELASVR